MIIYKGKGNKTLERGNFHGLNILDQVMKILETIAAKFIRGMVNINDMEFGFLPGLGHNRFDIHPMSVAREIYG